MVHIGSTIYVYRDALIVGVIPTKVLAVYDDKFLTDVYGLIKDGWAESRVVAETMANTIRNKEVKRLERQITKLKDMDFGVPNGGIPRTCNRKKKSDVRI